MATFYLPEDQRDLINALYGSDKPFNTMDEVAIFAAMVAVDDDRFDPLDSSERGQEIAERIFADHDKLGLLFVLATSHTGDSEVLSEDRYDEVWRIFEGYAKAGLGLIESWRQENPRDESGLETLLEKINTKARMSLQKDSSTQDISTTF